MLYLPCYLLMIETVSRSSPFLVFVRHKKLNFSMVGKQDGWRAGNKLGALTVRQNLVWFVIKSLVCLGQNFVFLGQHHYLSRSNPFHLGQNLDCFAWLSWVIHLFIDMKKGKIWYVLVRIRFSIIIQECAFVVLVAPTLVLIFFSPFLSHCLFVRNPTNAVERTRSYY